MAGRNAEDITKSGEKPVQFKCSVCNRCFDRKWYLIVHSRIHAPRVPKSKAPRSCPKCGKVFGCTSSHFWRHKRKCTIALEKYRCLLCPNNYSTLRRLSVHMKLHTVKSSLTCTTCNISFSTFDLLLEHMMIHTFTAAEPEAESEPTAENTNSEENVLNSSAGNGKQIKKSRCGICHKIFNHRYLHDHMNVHSGERPYKCPTCGRTFMFRSFMSTHIRKCKQRNNDDSADGHSRQDVNSAASPAVPVVIAEWTSQVADSHGSEVIIPDANDANSWLMIVKAEPVDSDVTDNESDADDTNNKPAEGLPETTLQSVQTMVENTVGQDIFTSTPIANSKKAKCNICDKIFNREYMSEHMNVHTGAKPHKCRTCGQSFMFRSFLATHRKKCVQQNADLPVPEVIAEWTTEATDNYHETMDESDVVSPEDGLSLVIVKSEPCDSDATDTELDADSNVPVEGPAGFGLPSMEHATENMDSQENFLSSSNEKYRCGVCQMVFSRGNSLRDHMNLHSGEEPYKCQTCGQGFKFRSSLAYHRKKKCSKQNSDVGDGHYRPDARAVPAVIAQSAASDLTDNSRQIPNRPDIVDSPVARASLTVKAEPVDSDATDCGSDADGTQTAVVTLAVYPLKLNEMRNTAFTDACSRANEFGVSYVKQNQKPEAVRVGCAFFSFKAVASARDVHRSLKTIRDDLTVRFIEPIENTKQIVESLRNPAPDVKLLQMPPKRRHRLRRSTVERD